MPAVTAAVERRRRLGWRFPDFWFDVAGEPYALDEPYVVSRATVAAIRAAARDAWLVFERVTPVVAALPREELLAIGMPSSAIEACRHAGGPSPTFFGRFDFALTAGGPKLLEFNAETAFFVWESFEIAGAIALAHGYDDPNAGMLDALRASIARELGGARRDARIAVTAYNTWREDWFTARFTARIASEALARDIDVVPVSELRVDNHGAYDATGRRIDVLWRYYPLEHFAHDPAAATFFARLLDGRLRLVNPARALLSQNKAAQAVAWGLLGTGTLDAATQERIERVFLPTYLDLPDDGECYVRKPVLGREGAGIAIFEAAESSKPPASPRTSGNRRCTNATWNCRPSRLRTRTARTGRVVASLRASSSAERRAPSACASAAASRMRGLSCSRSRLRANAPPPS